VSEFWVALAVAAIVAVVAGLVLAAVQGFRMLRRWFRGEAPN
jgi:Na+(H+)/acetate symporter ActP